PQDPTAGNLNAAVADNTATIVFDVLTDPLLPDGTILSNQAFVTAVDHGIGDVPSDDPRTPIVDDPTQDVVGNYPLLFAPKTAELVVDGSSPGVVDPGDTLRYTITVYNNGAVPATIVELTDDVPLDTTYVADTVTLNGEPVYQPDGGIFPLIDGIPISSSDLTPPVPNAGEGVVNPGESAVVTFDMQVNAAVPPGTLITNQATIFAAEVPFTLTDGDGNPSTGPEPTVVVVGDVQQLSIVKEVAVVGGGAALPGETLEYTVTVRNVGTVPAQYVTLYDDFDAVTPGYLSYVANSATLNGLVNGVTVAGSLITADYFNEYGELLPDEEAILRFRAVIDPNLVPGDTVTNMGRVSWDDPLRFEDDSVSLDVGAMPNAAIINGYVFHDADHSNTFGSAETPLVGWTVELLRDGQPIRTTFSGADGFYAFTNVIPNFATTISYSVRFSAPGTGPRTAMMGRTDSDFTDGLQRIDDISVQEGSLWDDQNMPIDPNGVVYNAVARTPVTGAMLTLVDVRSDLPVPNACFDDPNQQGQVTISNGYYKFDMNFSDPACPSGLNYLIRVTTPDSTWISGESAFIPAATNIATLPFNVPSCSGSGADAVLATTTYCEAGVSEFAPSVAVPARTSGTVYHLFLTLDDSQQPGSSQLFNNHIPLDPRLDGAVAVSKTTPTVNVTRGEMVPYLISVTNTYGANLTDANIIDRFPAGFRYVEGSARMDGVATEPVVAGRDLIWSGLTLVTDQRHEIKLLLAVGAGVSEGEFTNRAFAVSDLTGAAFSEIAEATVRLVPDPTFDCTDVTGKVFDDSNRNGYQDQGEEGLAGIRLVTPRGLAAKTDSQGRYHITCAIVPNENRGSDFVIKLDDRTLPSGFRPSTRPVQIARATRGKALKINFGASVHRIVGLDVADPVFEPGSIEMRPQWKPRINVLLRELATAPATLRLSYVADVEDESLVEQRLEALKEEILTAWDEKDCCYKLVVEPEIFWRLGEPPKRPKEVRQ
ncbi:MAG: isopeptide-forming domain-containing fimbrial protein, partial [Woeseiaceae bacterium]